MFSIKLLKTGQIYEVGSVSKNEPFIFSRISKFQIIRYKRNVFSHKHTFHFQIRSATNAVIERLNVDLPLCPILRRLQIPKINK